MRPIRIMPSDLALKIAAGEVIERPASAVKELVDNALDAEATVVRIEIREAGLKLIRVSDNGHGIPSADLPLAFVSHATSKITTFDDLEHLTTLGFRGEALASIAAVARVDMQTRTADAAVGARYSIEFGEAGAHGPVTAPVGTRVTVSDLFANVPARRTFVRSLRAESSQVATVVQQYALARPDVQFSLLVDGKPAFASPGSGRLRDVLAEVYGAAILDSMHAFEQHHDGITVSGLTSAPGLTRQNRAAITIAVNGRPVQNRSVSFALEEAYSGYLMVGRHPIAAVHITVPPHELDANIHPAKAEVRFVREREIHRLLYHAVAGTLLALRPEVPGGMDTPEWEALPPQPVQASLAADGGTASTAPRTRLRVFGQSSLTFIVAEGPEGLYMIDQHAAHERILFDQLDIETAQGHAASQPLLQPVTVELTGPQLAALDANRDLLERAGFAIEPFGASACLVRAIPVLARGGAADTMVSEVLSELETVPEPNAARERALAMMACKGAVKAGDPLEFQEMQELVAQLERTLRPHTCPHGRPTMIHLSHSQLEREFGRR